MNEKLLQEFKRKLADLMEEYNVEISIEHIEGCLPSGDESIQFFIPGKYTENGYLECAISFHGCELIPKYLRK